MPHKLSQRLFLTGLMLVLTLAPALAKDAAKSVTVPTLADPSAPVAPAAPTVATPTAPKPPAEAPTDSVTVADITLSKASLSPAKGNIDLFLTIKNAGKVDERITGAGTAWNAADTVQVTKDKDGKETETPVAFDIPAGKTVELSKDGTWLRFKDVKDQPKGATVMPASFYFRHSPNANLKIALTAKSGGIMDWFSK